MTVIAFPSRATPLPLSSTEEDFGYLRWCRALALEALKREDFAEAFDHINDAFAYEPAAVDRRRLAHERAELFEFVLGEARTALFIHAHETQEEKR
jgi:hypothetical protein